MTTKGGLVRSILYPPPVDFTFEQDTYKFIGILSVIAAVGFLYTIISKSTRNLSPGNIIVKALDIITIVVPPALPATMTIGKMYAQTRLHKAKIYCINPRVINVSGSINCVCFDKTGTLTEDGLDMWGVVPVQHACLQVPVKTPNELLVSDLLYGMASCHSITLINGELSGDPLDIKMFEFTDWILEEPEIEDTSKFDLLAPSIVKPRNQKCLTLTEDIENVFPLEIGILHQFQFSSSLQRMSVITRRLGSQKIVVYCKGSPEMIISLSQPDTVPKEIISALSEYTAKGYRVLALGKRVLQKVSFHNIPKLSRDDVENNLEFLGVIILENRLKLQTTDVIRELKNANLKVVMITGDNLETAISVAKECNIVEDNEMVINVLPSSGTDNKNINFVPYRLPAKQKHTYDKNLFNGDHCELGKSNCAAPYKFAATGSTWAILRNNQPDLIPKIITRGAVFARMSSDQKQQLILELQDLGYSVAMCGDGANDCGALKAAQAGISLSEAEASVASPFTSKEGNISCVPLVIREGRAALVTAFGIFKFMVAYSLTEFLSVAILYSIDSNLTDFEFLFIDICLAVVFAMSFGKTEAYQGPLVKKTPETTLYTMSTMSSLFLQMILFIIFQISSFYLVKTFPWYTPFKLEDQNVYQSYENYSIFAVSLFQYITMAIIFSHGPPYRKHFFTNYLLVISLVVMTIICTYITIYPSSWIISILELKVPESMDFPVIVVCLGLVNFGISFFVENVIVKYVICRYYNYPVVCLRRSSEKRFIQIENDIENKVEWPPLFQS